MSHEEYKDYLTDLEKFQTDNGSMKIDRTSNIQNGDYNKKRIRIFLDLETTGHEGVPVFGVSNRCIQFGVISNLFRMTADIKPPTTIPRMSTMYHGITNDKIEKAASFLEIWRLFEELVSSIDEVFIMTHNGTYFDEIVIETELALVGIALDRTKFIMCDTLPMFQFKYPNRRSYSLGNLTKSFIPNFTFDAHNALGDATALQKLCKECEILPFSKSVKRDDLRFLRELNNVDGMINKIKRLGGISLSTIKEKFTKKDLLNIIKSHQPDIDSGILMMTLFRIYGRLGLFIDINETIERMANG
jgi:DNA polymerase III alpha subunit (gram-positive type)